MFSWMLGTDVSLGLPTRTTRNSFRVKLHVILYELLENARLLWKALSENDEYSLVDFLLDVLPSIGIPRGTVDVRERSGRNVVRGKVVLPDLVSGQPQRTCLNPGCTKRPQTACQCALHQSG